MHNALRPSLHFRHFLLALQFFTRVPVTGRLANWVGYSPEMLRASAGHFPGIGWLVGGAAAGVFGLTWYVLTLAGHSSQASAWVASVLSTITTVLMTGGFHEDGLADVADGLGGSLQRERALVIMKDSRVGAFGVLALVLVLALKFALLALLAGQSSQADLRGVTTAVVVPLIAGHVLSRFAPLWLIRWLPHVGDDATSKSKPLADQISAGALGIAFLWSIPAFVLISWSLGAIKTVVSVALLATTLAWMYRWFQRRLQGFTGDCLGATQQVGELAFYLGLAIAPAFSPVFLQTFSQAFLSVAR